MKTARTIIALLATTLIAGATLAAEPIGQVIAVEGEARAVRPDGAAEQLALDSVVYLNDRIQTLSESKLQILLADDAVVAMGEESSMTLDEFVYNPNRKEENSTTIGLIQGVFRVITARITDMNPEQFKVKSNKATIGIRGCELGFVIAPDVEDIQIIRLPERKMIRVEHAEGGSLDIRQQGTLVRADDQGGLERRPLAPADIAAVVAQTTPPTVATESTTVRLADKADAFEEAAGLTPDAAEVAAGVRLSDSGVLIASDEAVNPTPSPDDLVQMASAGISRAEQVEMPSMPVPEVVETQPTVETVEDVAEVPLLPVVAPPAAAAPSPGPGPEGETFPRLGVPAQVASASGQGWSWGAWEQVDVLNAAGDTRSTFTVSGANAGVTPAALNDLLNGPNLVTLEGSIQAAAVLAMAEQGRLMITDANGANLFSVTAGFGALAPWAADMTLASAQGDRLIFSANGFVNAADGSFAAPASAYSLTAFGQNYGAGSLTANQLSGSLVGADQVRGVAGDFRFEHGAGPSVNGVFGADLNPRP